MAREKKMAAAMVKRWLDREKRITGLEKPADVIKRWLVDAAALEAAAVKAGVAEELLKIWRRGRLSNEALIKLINEGEK